LLSYCFSYPCETTFSSYFMLSYESLLAHFYPLTSTMSQIIREGQGDCGGHVLTWDDSAYPGHAIGDAHNAPLMPDLAEG